MQWQGMEWPVLLDSLNLLGCKAIPYSLLIDPHGIVRYVNPKDNELQAFLETDYPEGDASNSERFPSRTSPEGQILWGTNDRLDGAIAAFEARVAAYPEDSAAAFRLGVAYRQRFDSPKRHPGDFSRAIHAWKQALSLDPAQYIWRRRIQQYGPRLDKPYAFYDWVHEARRDLRARGETPHPLRAEPSGAEFATPQKGPSEAMAVGEHPDPLGKVPIDETKMIRVVTTKVPSTQKDSPAFRVHIRLTPDALRKVHWTNDAGPLQWVFDTDGVTLGDLHVSSPPKDLIASEETRHIEFEWRPKKGEAAPKTIKGSAYYYVCEDTDGQCLFLRQPISIPLNDE